MNGIKCIDDVVRKIDYTLLKIDSNIDIIRRFVSNGKKYRFRALVVMPYFLKFIRDDVRDSDIKLVSVVGFPFGQTYSKTKLLEAEEAINSGAVELDIVLNTSMLKSSFLNEFREEAKYILKYLKMNYPDIIVKYIVEVTVLSRNLLRKGLEIINDAKPDFFKTSTGYGPRGTSAEDIVFIKRYLSDEIYIKAAGGIRHFSQFKRLLDCGADIIGSSNGDKIVEEARDYLDKEGE